MAGTWKRLSIDTRFHIDLNWWQETSRDIRVFMRELLCEECGDAYGDYEAVSEIDWVDEQTGEVTRVDALWHALRTCCSNKPGYIEPTTPVVDAVFRTFLANGNKPLSIRELYELLDRRPPEMLLRILTGGQVYMGIRPAI
jgi:hypothetical protein